MVVADNWNHGQKVHCGARLNRLDQRWVGFNTESISASSGARGNIALQVPERTCAARATQSMEYSVP